MLTTIFNLAQIILAILLIVLILMQARGSGVGAIFGGGGGNVYRTKRGIEKKLYQMTIVVAILFFGVSLASVLI